jgi:hypothetical protein
MLVRMQGRGFSLIHCCWESKLAQPLWNSVWTFLTKLKIGLQYNPAVPILVIYAKESKSAYSRETCTPVLIIRVLFIIVKLFMESA